MTIARPLAGERVIVTRAEHQSAEWIEAFTEAGAEVLHLPLLEIVPPADPAPFAQAMQAISTYEWLVLTSSNTVAACLAELSSPLPRGLRIAVVGPATAAAVRNGASEPDIVAETSDALGLLATLTPHLENGSRVLVPQAADARPDFVEGLRRLSIHVRRVVAYDKRLPATSAARTREILALPGDLWVTFTSSRIVRHFIDLCAATWPQVRPRIRALSIGRVTSSELRRHGLAPVEADQPTLAAMVTAAIRSLHSAPRIPR